MSAPVRRQIVIIESAPTDMLAKISLLLRRRGYETVLITLLPGESPLLREAYSQRITCNFKFFKIGARDLPKIASYAIKRSRDLLRAWIQIRNLQPSVVIGRGTPNWLCATARLYFKKYPFVYFPYDIRSFVYTSYREARASGVPAFEIRAERSSFENSDGILHKGDDRELSFLDPKVLGGPIHIRSPTLHFLPYCLSELVIPPGTVKKISAKDKNIHMVFVGHIGIEKEWIASVKAILDQKIYLHLYGKTAYLSKEESYGKVKEDYKEILESPYLKLHDPVEQKDLSREIAKYDYGTWLGYYNARGKNVYLATGNKLASYIEAGIPLIYFENHRAVTRIINKYGIGIPVSISQLKHIKKTLKNHDYGKAMQSMKRAQRDFSLERHIGRLETFFNEVRTYKYEKKTVKENAAQGGALRT